MADTRYLDALLPADVVAEAKATEARGKKIRTKGALDIDHRDARKPEEPCKFAARFEAALPFESGRDSRPSKFTLEPFESIQIATGGEWLTKKLIPKKGVGVLYGASQSFKTFVATDFAFSVALGWPWAGRRVTQAPVVYIAAEGAAGLRKRKEGFTRAHRDLPAHVPFSLISAAPNLGTSQDDLRALIASIKGAGVTPGLIVIDTLAQTLGTGDENGGGMIHFVSNATALANRFDAFVLILHHIGLGDDKRARGHSSLVAGVDVQILCERKDKALDTMLTWQKLKDEDSNTTLRARLSRVLVATDEDGDEVSTLVVDGIEDAEPLAGKPSAHAVPAQQRLLMLVVAEAINESGQSIRPFGDGPLVRAAADVIIRARYYARIAEQADPGEDKGKLAQRQSKAFRRAIEQAIKAQSLFAAEYNGKRFVWLP